MGKEMFLQKTMLQKSLPFIQHFPFSNPSFTLLIMKNTNLAKLRQKSLKGARLSYFWQARFLPVR
ncbi:MAG: hypothetical protein R3B47_20515 [Bacteroidia bacterium]